jgi:hypothetical protein
MYNFIASIFTYLAALLTLAFGFVYFFRPSFLPYHQLATQKKWDELDSNMQALILGFMRVISGGLLSGGATIVILQYKFNQTQQDWLPLTILVCGGILTIGLLYGMFLVRLRTQAHPPLIAGFAGIILLVIGYILNICNL